MDNAVLPKYRDHSCSIWLVNNFFPRFSKIKGMGHSMGYFLMKIKLTTLTFHPDNEKCFSVIHQSLCKLILTVILAIQISYTFCLFALSDFLLYLGFLIVIITFINYWLIFTVTVPVLNNSHQRTIQTQYPHRQPKKLSNWLTSGLHGVFHKKYFI